MIIVSYWVSYGNGGPIIGVPINSTKSYWLKHHSTQKKTVQLLSQNGQGQALLAGNSGSALLEAWCQYAQQTVAHPPWWLHTRFVCMDDEHPQKPTMIEIYARVLATFQNQTNMWETGWHRSCLENYEALIFGRAILRLTTSYHIIHIKLGKSILFRRFKQIWDSLTRSPDGNRPGQPSPHRMPSGACCNATPPRNSSAAPLPPRAPWAWTTWTSCCCAPRWRCRWRSWGVDDGGCSLGRLGAEVGSWSELGSFCMILICFFKVLCLD